MKKALLFALIFVLAFSSLVGCSPSEPATNNEAANQPSNEPAKEASNELQITKIGLGHITSIGKSKDLTVATDGTKTLPIGQVDTVMAAVAFDKNGKVVKVTIDNAQTRVNFDEKLQVTSDLKATYKTKAERGMDYGMLKVSKIQKEWFQQIAALEEWMIGKTVAEIKAMKVKAVDEAHPSVPDIPELTSTVTITVQDYIAAVEEAYQTAVAVEKEVDSLGLGHVVAIGKSKSYAVKDGAETLPLAQVDAVMSATAFDKDGKVVRTLIDNAQIRVAFDKDGKVTTDKKSDFKTKAERGMDYGMLKVSKIQKEWFQQIAALEEWMIGKTVDEIKAMKVKEVDAAHPSVPDIAELTSTVTITVQDYIAAVAEAFQNKK